MKLRRQKQGLGARLWEAANGPPQACPGSGAELYLKLNAVSCQIPAPVSEGNDKCQIFVFATPYIYFSYKCTND